MTLLADLPRPLRWLSISLCAVAALALAGQLAVYVDYTASLLRFPFDYDQGEGFELYDTLLHTQGRWPYQDSQVFPFYTSIYPPVFHLLTAPLVAAFGPRLWTGRLISFLASLIAAGAIGWAVRRAGGSRIAAAFAGLLFLASNYTFAIGPLFRQHMTMVMFETLAIVTLAAFDWPAQAARGSGLRPAAWLSRRLALGLLLLLLAGFTKQLALATVLAALAWLFLRGPRRALLAGLGLALTGGLVFLAIDWATGGWWTVSIIQANINEFDIPQAIGFYREWLELHLVVAIAAFAGLIREAYFGRLSLYGVWFAFAFANGALSGKFGAGESYFVTTTAAACIVAGLAAARLLKFAATPAAPRRLGGLLALALPIAILIQTRLTLHLYTDGPIYGPIARALGVTGERGFYDSQGYTQLGPRPTPTDVAAGYKIVELARAAPGPVFSEEAAFVFEAGKPVVTNAFPQLVMFQAGLFDPAEEIAMIDARHFGLVILRAQFYPPPVLAALGANYRPLTEIVMNGFTYRILEPRP